MGWQADPEQFELTIEQFKEVVHSLGRGHSLGALSEASSSADVGQQWRDRWGRAPSIALRLPASRTPLSPSPPAPAPLAPKAEAPPKAEPAPELLTRPAHPELRAAEVRVAAAQTEGHQAMQSKRVLGALGGVLAKQIW